MKKTVIIVAGLLLCAAAATVIGQKKVLSPKEERREVREKRRAERIANYEKFMDSLVLSRTVIEPGSVYAGVPAKRVKDVTPEQVRDIIERTARDYMMYARSKSLGCLNGGRRCLLAFGARMRGGRAGRSGRHLRLPEP